MSSKHDAGYRALQLLILVIPFVGLSAVLLRAAARWLPLAAGRVRPTIVTGLTASIGLLLITAISGVTVHRGHQDLRSDERRARLSSHVELGALRYFTVDRRTVDRCRRHMGYLRGGG